ncbi:hypothetical protein PSPO01_15873 [Paraphaeosphaeria sporulosa]
MTISRAVVVAMHGKTLHFPELHTALFSSDISTNHCLINLLRRRSNFRYG